MPLFCWLQLETYMFGMFIVGLMLFSMYWSVRNYWKDKDATYGDANKQVEDFLSYKQDSYYWFALNFVLISVPIVIARDYKENAIFSTSNELNSKRNDIL